MAAPFHIIGAGRGGTSLLAGLFDEHPECEVVSEALSQRHLMEPDRPHASDETLAARTARRIDAFTEACEAAATQSNTALWGHKATTEHVRGLEAPPARGLHDTAAHFVRALAGTPVIFILRDGRTCIPSKMRRTGQSLDLAIERWMFCIALFDRFRREHDRLHVMRLEDLVGDPEPQLALACRFVGISYDRRMLGGTMSRKMLPEYRRKGFDLSTVEVAGDPPWVDRIAGALRLAGY